MSSDETPPKELPLVLDEKHRHTPDDTAAKTQCKTLSTVRDNERSANEGQVSIGNLVCGPPNAAVEEGFISNDDEVEGDVQAAANWNRSCTRVVCPPSDVNVSKAVERSAKRVYKLVLTGGPCAGKTTGQNRVSDFFENLGWKVFRVPETANILLGGGVKFAELTPQDALAFQENLIKTMLAIENTYFTLAETCPKNCLVICDRGIMDATAFITAEEWTIICKKNNWKTSSLRDKRYDHVIHMVSAANGAETFYTTDDHETRSEGVELARELDHRAATAWIGHPYFDVIDNSTSFDHKLIRTIDIICNRVGIDVGDRLTVESRKRKFLVATLPPDFDFPEFQDFDVIHDYLSTPLSEDQARLRARGQGGDFTYSHTIRRSVKGDQEKPELKKTITKRDYKILYAQKDPRRYSIYKRRRCFVWKHHYFQLDIFVDPSPSICRGLVLLETYTADSSPNFLQGLPSFLKILREVTGDPSYSMYNLSLMDEYRATSGIAANSVGFPGFCRSEGSVDVLRRRAKSETGSEFSAVLNLALNSPKERDRRYSGKVISASSASSLNSASSEEGVSEQDGEKVFADFKENVQPSEVNEDKTSQHVSPSEPFHPSEALLEIEFRNGTDGGISHRPTKHLSSLLPRSSSLPSNNCINAKQAYPKGNRK